MLGGGGGGVHLQHNDSCPMTESLVARTLRWVHFLLVLVQ